MSGATVVRTLRAELAERLASAGIEEAQREAGDLIAAVMDQPRSWPITHASDVLDGDAVRLAAERRAQGMPFAYAVGKAAFRRLTLAVDQRVLIPRQETEHLVDLVLSATRGRGVVADVGTGSGCIALALATEGQFDRVIATEFSQEAKAVAQTNADLLHSTLRSPTDVRGGDLLAPLTTQDGVTAIVSNPPYIAEWEMAALPSSVRDWEPHLALVSVEDGLACTHQIIDQAAAVLMPGGLLALECDSRRAQRVAEYARRSGAYHTITVHCDFTERERYLLAYKR